MSDPLARKTLDRYVASARKGFEADLKRLVDIPTVSMDPERTQDMTRGAKACAAVLEAHGARARVVPTKGHPTIIGEMVAGRSNPWVTIYNHMDVQPADEPTWVREPFTMTVEGDEYFGRGATDDKGPGLTALYAARYAVDNGVPVNVRFLWEMEEEIGSPNFEAMVKKEGERLATDSVLVSDTIWIAKGRPACPYGLRGMQGLSIHLTTGVKDTHSGLTGGAARNAVAELAWLAGRMLDARTGRCKIPGFYEDVRPLTPRERKSFADAGFSVPRFKKAHELRSLRSNDPKDVMKRLWAMPTFEVHGITGGYQGPGIKTVVPTSAELKISCRLVPDMKPAKVVRQVRAFVKELIPDAKVRDEHRLDWFQGPDTGPYADAAAEALRFGFGRGPAFIREGGSIGAVLTMSKQLKCPIMMIGLSLPEHGYHCPNEKYDWGQASGGMKTFVKYLDLISRLG